jgi:hypothetical protein
VELIGNPGKENAMEVPIKPDAEQRETPTTPAAGDVVSKNNSVAASGNRESGARANTLHKDPRTAQKLARKKRMRAAHRRRLKTSNASG